jgi:hypothetical protein
MFYAEIEHQNTKIQIKAPCEREQRLKVMQYATTRTTCNSSEPASPKRMGVWGFQVKRSGADETHPYCAWLFITEQGKRYASYVRLPMCETQAIQHACTFNGEGARHVALERMHVNKSLHRRLPKINSWSRRWDAARQAEVWTFVSEHGHEFTAELMQSNCEHPLRHDSKPQAWVHTRSEAV